jgi:hypothetical protein
MGRGDDVAAPNNLANLLSLYKHRLRFAEEVARNFAGPDVVVDAAFPLIVLELVSRMFAVTYVPVYNAKIRAKGLERRKWCGRRVNVFRDSRNEAPSVFLPEAFSIMALSIAVMTGATRTPAVAAEATSAPSRRPRLCVFQVDGVVVFGLMISGLRVVWDTPRSAAEVIAS